jgi:hypothetical protein
LLSLEALEDRRLMTVSGWGASNGANPGYADPPPIDDNGTVYTDAPTWGNSQPGMEPLAPGDNGYVDPGNQDWRGLKRAAESDFEYTDSVEAPTIGVLPGMPMLNSNPRATHTIYLNFTGSRMTRDWSPDGFPNVNLGKHHTVFDLDGDASRFSDGEADAIYRIWKYVADDYAPFDVNVTTVNNNYNPSVYWDNVLEVAIGGWVPRNEEGEGLYGVAHFNQYARLGEDAVYVFSDRHKDTALAQYDDDAQGAYEFFVKAVAGTAAHEAGHAFGLEHQSWFSSDGERLEKYRPAATTGNGTQAAIMGRSFREDGGPESRSLWAEGLDEFGKWQSDVQVLAARLGVRADDRPDDTFVDLPQLDPGHFFTTGFIGANDCDPSGNDVDWFRFLNPGGPVHVYLDSPAGAFGNLHANIELWNIQTNERVQVAAVEGPVNGFGFLHLPEGMYMLGVSNTGGYGNLGNYELEVGAFGSAGDIKVPGPLGTIVDVSSMLPGLDGQFESLYALNSARQFIPVVDDSAFTAVQAAHEAGDFTGDGHIDGGDFLAWQLGFGATVAPHMGSDATGDGFIDDTDLLRWQSEFGLPVSEPDDAGAAPAEDGMAYVPFDEPGNTESSDATVEPPLSEELAADALASVEDAGSPAAYYEFPADELEYGAAVEDGEESVDWSDGAFVDALDEVFAEFA